MPHKGKHYPSADLEEDGMQNEMSRLTLEVLDHGLRPDYVAVM